jgi:phosphoribosylanthranilate isomerase
VPTRVKICGVTLEKDAVNIAKAGADALGFVFYKPSPRYVSPEQAATMIKALPPFITSVGLFVDADHAFIEEVLKQVPLDLLQFHGNETEAQCSAFGRPYIKSLRMEEGLSVFDTISNYPSCSAILLDTYVANTPGGTGRAFDWSRVPLEAEKPIILAGGLTPENVAQAISVTRPWAVDVSGGVEKAKGIKDLTLVHRFVEGARRVKNTG